MIPICMVPVDDPISLDLLSLAGFFHGEMYSLLSGYKIRTRIGPPRLTEVVPLPVHWSGLARSRRAGPRTGRLACLYGLA